MSTTASIARVLDDGSVEATRCNFDGYDKGGVGDQLTSNFPNFEDSDNLFIGQEIRSIENGEIEFYPESWDETYDNANDWLTKLDENFGYIFIGENWHVARPDTRQLKAMTNW